MGASFPIVAQAVPNLFLSLVVVGDGKRFELVEPDFLGSLSFDEARGDIGEFQALPNEQRRNTKARGHIIDAQTGLNYQIVEGDELVSRVHGHPNDILGEAGFRGGGGVNDVTWNRERLGNLLLFGQALQSSKASASSDHFVFTGV